MYLDRGKLKQALILLLLFALGGFLFLLLKGFLSAFLGSVVFYIILRRPYFYLTEGIKKKWNRNLVLAMLMIVSFLVLVLPILLVSIMLSGKVSYLIAHYEDILRYAQSWSATAKDYVGVDLLTPETVGKLTAAAADVLPKLLSATANMLVDIFVIYFLLYFMLAHARQLEKTAREFLPFKKENNALLLSELKIQTISNSIGVPLLALVQAIAAWVGYMIFGVDQAFFWAVLTGVFSVLPVVGTTIVWVPLGVALYLSGNHWQGIGLLIYGTAIITNIVETFFRFVVQKKLGDVHPLITFFGVIIGLDLFGFVGLIFGPLLISYLILLLKIYKNEYLDDNTEGFYD
ncbi:MAG: family transporter [Mucilaginibacter sp.]|nr:family transporter [Mucilaginibacter sp.]